MNEYATLVADPPWRFGNTATRAAANDHYGTLTRGEIAEFKVDGRYVSEWMKDAAHLYLWCPSALLHEGLDVMRSWSFEFKQTLIWVKTRGPKIPNLLPCRSLGDAQTWLKSLARGGQLDSIQIGLGNYFRHAHEVVLFGTRGKCKAQVHDLPTVFFAPRGRHSAKPEILQNMAELLSPGPRLELFARRHRPGWICRGRELDGRSRLDTLAMGVPPA